MTLTELTIASARQGLREKQFSARELTEALIVNPYDLEGVAETLRKALIMSSAEQRDRMRALREQVAEANVYRWAGRMLLDATRVRQKNLLHVRLAGKGGRRFR